MPSSCPPYNSTSYAVVAGVSAGMALLSILLLLLVMIATFLLKRWQEVFGHRLVLYLTTSALLVNLAIILHRVDYANQTSDFYRRFCQFGGYLDLVSNWMLLLAISAITLYCSLLLYFGRRTEKYERLYVAAIFLLPFLFTWVPFVRDSYGRAGAWCWIRSEEPDCSQFAFGQWLQFGMWFIPLYLIMLVLIVLYIMILVKLYCSTDKTPGTNHQENQAKLKTELVHLVAYPLIYFLLNIFPFVNRTYNLANSHQPSLALWYLAALANPTIGLWVGMAFALDPETRKRLRWAELKAAARELCRRGRGREGEQLLEECVAEGRNKGGKEELEAGNSTESHPYQSYEDCYKLNLSTTSTSTSKGNTQ